MKNLIKLLGICFLLLGLVRCGTQPHLLSYVTNRNGAMNLVFYHAEDGDEWLMRESQADQTYPAFNQDQSKFLYVEDGEERKIKVIHPLDRRFILSVPISSTATDPFWYPNGDFGYVDGKEIHRVTFAYGHDEIAWMSPTPVIRPFWSADEEKLYGSFLVGEKYELGCFHVAADTYETLVTGDAQLIVSDYSEEKAKVLYTEFGDLGNRIMVCDLETGEVTAVIEDEFRNESGIFDGEDGAIIFQSDRDHAGSAVYNYEIYRWDGNRNEYQRLTNNEAGDYFPAN